MYHMCKFCWRFFLGLSKPMVTLPPLSANTSLIRGKDLSCTRVFQQQVQKLVLKQGLDHHKMLMLWLSRCY